MDTKTLNQKLDTLSKVFDIMKKDDEVIDIISNETPEEIKNLLFTHGFQVQDFYYSTGAEAMASFLQYLNEKKDDPNADFNNDIFDDFDWYSEVEPDVYTHDLTKWLHKNVENVYYLTEALEEYQPNDGFQLLAMAQTKAKEEVYEIIKQTIIDYLDEEIDEDNKK